MSETVGDFIKKHLPNLINIIGDEREAEFELRQMLATVIRVPRIGFFELESRLNEDQSIQLDTMLERRLRYEPIQYILGEWDFMGIPFYVNDNVLIPRQDTETIVEIAEGLIRKRRYKTLLDICTGTGCIGISLAKRTGIDTVLSDISIAVLDIANRNAKRNGVKCMVAQSDLFKAISGRFDVITVNPPYIESQLCNALQPEVQYEPRLALDGGADGLDFYHRMREDFKEYLNPGGVLLMEIGYDQGYSVCKIFENCGEVSIYRDLCGNNRVVSVDTYCRHNQ